MLDVGVPALRDEENSAGPQDRRLRHFKARPRLSPREIKPYLFHYRAQDRDDGAFDLVISLGCQRNLRLFELETAVQEINRVGKNKYTMVEI